MQTNDNELFRGFVVLDASASCVASDTLLLDLAGRLLAAALLAARSGLSLALLGLSWALLCSPGLSLGSPGA